jgi:inward rectifier potassium channel
MVETTPPTRRNSEIDLDLGFGNVISSQSHRRLLNRDGTFNVRRTGLGFLESLSVYHFLQEISCPPGDLLALIPGPGMRLVHPSERPVRGDLRRPGTGSAGRRRGHVGAGLLRRGVLFQRLHPCHHRIRQLHTRYLAGGRSATLESLAGLLTFGLVAGIMFARFARPNAHIIFSRNALIAPDGTKLEAERPMQVFTRWYGLALMFPEAEVYEP